VVLDAELVAKMKEAVADLPPLQREAIGAFSSMRTTDD